MTPISREELLSWTERAASIQERLSGDYVPGPRTEEGDARFARWSKAMGEAPECMERRLRWSGIAEGQTQAACAGASLAGGVGSLPGWARALERVFEGPLARAASIAFYPAEGAWPFQEALAPLVSAASGLIPEDVWQGITPAARVGLERQLLSLLSEASVEVLNREFQVERAVARAVRGTMQGNLYQRFVARLVDEGGWRKIFSSYPVMARLMGTRVDCWLTNTLEFVERLNADREALQAMFRPYGLGAVTMLRPGLSDSHNDGRTAIWVEFASGLQCVYKPRSIESETAFQGLLGWLNIGYRRYRTLTRAGYGWSEAVPHLACETEEQVRRYYQRIGALAAMLYGMGATDCHQENVIASGEFPVLIDTETILTPRLQKPPENVDRGTAAGLSQGMQHHSVLRSLLLPPGSNLPGRDYSHLVGVMRADSDPTFQALTWANPNSDWMRLREQEMRMPAERNQVLLKGAPAGAEQYVDEIVTGFQAAYRTMLAHRDELMAGPMQELRGLEIRAVCRATHVYGRLLRRLADPAVAVDGVEASMALDVLGRPFLGTEEMPPAFALVSAELRAMTQGDVPLFATRGDSVDIVGTGGERIAGFFEQSGWEVMRQSLEGLSETDLRAQASLIRGAFAAVPYRARKEEERGEQVSFRDEEFLEEAVAIAGRIRESAILAEDGSCFWLTVHPVGDEGWSLGPAAHSLYGGLSGIGLFLAGVYRVTGDSSWKELSLATLRTVSAETREYARATLGGGGGIPSTAYAVLRCGELLEEPHLRDEALRLALMVTPELIEKDGEYDVISGAAGTILCMLELYRALEDARLLELARLCGDHLLQRRSENGSEYRSWATLGEKHLAGLTHGAAGIALALERLYGVTKNEAYREAALEALKYEDTLFDAGRSNWPDLRKPGNYTGSWCHGAPGIGLARLEFLGIAPEAAADVEAAIKFTLQSEEGGIDHVCCGQLGRVEFLQAAGAELGRPEVIEAARAMASGIVAGARRRGHYRLNWSERFDWPTFHQGLAGIGYQLLRMAAPLSGILRWR